MLNYLYYYFAQCFKRPKSEIDTEIMEFHYLYAESDVYV